VSDQEMAQIDMLPHDFHGEWNYTIRHRKRKTSAFNP